jgi:PadR family transcriptional regulator, regulatory protein PadR
LECGTEIYLDSYPVPGTRQLLVKSFPPSVTSYISQLGSCGYRAPGTGQRIRLRPSYLSYNLIVMSPATLGTLELATLLAVARLKDKAYGLAIKRDLAARTGRDYSVGALYTTLQRLEDKGLLTSRHSEPLPVRGGRSRRHFTLTGAGARALRQAERHAASIWGGVGKTLRPRLA